MFPLSVLNNIIGPKICFSVLCITYMCFANKFYQSAKYSILKILIIKIRHYYAVHYFSLMEDKFIICKNYIPNNFSKFCIQLIIIHFYKNVYSIYFLPLTLM